MKKQVFEVWKTIKDYEGFYEVSNWGRVKSLGRFAKGSNNSLRFIKGKLLKLARLKSGHLYVNLSKNGVHTPILVHRLVAQAFIPNPNGYTVVHHLNENPNDNRVENLIWMSDEAHRGTHIKERCSKRVDQIDKVTGEVLHQWERTMDVERELGYNHQNISACCNGKRNSAYDYVWKQPILA